MKKMNLKELIEKWTTEEGIHIPNDSIDFNLNKPIFRLNSNKLLTCEILKTFKIPHVEVLSLTDDKDFATKSAKTFLEQSSEQKIVIRGNKGMCGFLTFFVEKEEEIRAKIEELINQNVLPLASPYYEAQHEYRAFWLDNKLELVIRKEKNPETGMHNLSTGAVAKQETNPGLLQEIENIAKEVADVFQLGFAGIDILHTKEGLKVLELSIPNIARFAMQNEQSEQLAKELFMKAVHVANKK